VSGGFNAYPDTDTADLELWFNTANPFRRAWVFSLLAGVLLLSGLALGARWRWTGRLLHVGGLLCCTAALAWAVVGFWCRVTVSGRPPVSNMYESIIWVAFMTAAIGLALELVYRRGVIALCATLVSALGFVLADQLPLTFNPSIQPLQAVLRSNYWLIVHVLTIVSSYAAFALAWGLGNVNLGLILWAPQRTETIKALSGYCYRAIQIGVVLLAAGTFLGGFWAAESWGRFWGWDPKEVWALIALLCYLIPLHARLVGWVRDFGLAVCAVVCFASVVMAWYGVNFVLGAGLHSYGFGGGRDAWVYFAGLANLALVAHAALRYRAAQQHTVGHPA
jgi:ABC-type transport system involved in cytochrome c biogenesis permease subunit